jgi:hypothetical protein
MPAHQFRYLEDGSILGSWRLRLRAEVNAPVREAFNLVKDELSWQ